MIRHNLSSRHRFSQKQLLDSKLDVRPKSPVTILPAVTESEWLVPLRRCAMKQTDVVHCIAAAGLVIDAPIVPHHEIARGPFVTIRVFRRGLVSK